MTRVRRIAASACVCLSLALGGPWNEAGRVGVASAWADHGAAAGKGEGGNGVGNGNGGGSGGGNGNGRGRGSDDGGGPGSGRGGGNNGVGADRGGRGEGRAGRGADQGRADALGRGERARQGSPPGHARSMGAQPDTVPAAPALAATPSAPPAREGGGAEPDEVLALDLSPGDAELARAAGFTVRAHERLAELDARVTVLQVPAGISAQQALRALSARSPQALLALNTRYGLAGESCASDKCYGQVLIGWGEAEPGSCGRPVRLGMIDTPVDAGSPLLAVQRVHARSFVDAHRPAPDTHGTAVATLLVGNGSPHFSGLIPGASLFAANVFYLTADGSVTTNARLLLAALDWLLQQEVELVNLSFSGPPNRLLEHALRKTHARGVIVVAAAGNGGATAPPAYPAAYPTVIAVTALDRYYRPYASANRGAYVAFAAPGVDIWTPDRSDAGSYHSGTSFAAAFASGIVADLLARGPAARMDVEQRLRPLTRDLGATGRDPVYGWGLLRGEPRCPQYVQAP